MRPQTFFKITFWLLLNGFFFKTGFFHGHSGHTKLIVISFDGFRWDYLDNVKKQGMLTPNFDKLFNDGSSILNDGVKNVFLTKTFPNHYSMATGLYEESHGIVANSFFDPVFNETFNMSDASSRDKKWWDGKSGKATEPIWVTNEKCQCERKSGVIFWPGSHADNQRPSHLLEYNVSVSEEVKIDTLVDWFHNDEPINLGMLYINEPDKTGHRYGPESKELIEKIVELDGLLGYLIDELEEHEMLHGMNFIITSDHGMVEQKETIYLKDHISPDFYRVFGSTPVLNMLPNEGYEEEIYNKLKDVPNLDVYKKSEIPAEYHYRNNRRIMPLIVVAKEGYRICAEKNITKCVKLKGDHGYNNSLKSMHPIFVASGPAFRTNHRLEKPFETVDIYLLICKVLGLKPHDNEGDFARISDLLPRTDRNLGEDIVFISIILAVVGVSATFCVCVCINHCDYFMKRSVNLRSESPKEGQKHLLTSEEDDELV